MIRTLLLVVALLTPSCFVSRARVNDPLMEEAIARLEPGATTARDVVELLGAPTEVVQLGHRSAYRYDHTVTKRAGMFLIVVTTLNDDVAADRLWVFFDERDVLTHSGATLEADLAAYRMPWSK